jgi:FkbM family methyltransferase
MNSIFVKVLNRLNWLKHVNVFYNARIHEREVFIPVLNGVGLENIPFTEIWMCDLIRYSLAIKTGFFMDIGANVGQTLIKLRAVDEERAYVGFEPNPECVHYFNQLVKKNKFKNVELIPVGLFESNTVLTLKMYTDTSTDQGATLIDNFRDGIVYHKINVPVFDYQHLAGSLNLRDMAMIKIDVEGAELEVLNSLKSTIEKNQPVILVEILPAYGNEYTDRVERQNQIGSLMLELGYDILRVHKKDPYDKVEKLEKLSGFDIHGNILFTDYVLAPAALSENMIHHFNHKS